MVAGAGAGAGARAERKLLRDVSVSVSSSLRGSVVGGVSGSVSGNVGGRFSSSNISGRIGSGSGIRSWTLQCMVAAAEQQRDGSGVGGGSLCRSVDKSVVGSVGRSFGGSCSSIGSGVSRPVYWPFDAM